MSEAFEEQDNPPPELKLDRDLFLEWRSPRRGRANPEAMTNPVWTALVETRLSAWQANEKMGGPDSMDAGPCWCFSRFGQSRTELPDGRVVFIAGEHEDHYDADFYIYNDVVIRHPDGRIEILGYSDQAFPPTDFHSATLSDGQIILIGNLDYPDQRKPGSTQVAILSLADFSVRLVSQSGEGPGWLHKHTAEMSGDRRSIVIKGGRTDPGGDAPSIVENIDEWKLHVDGWRWERLTNRQWLRWEFSRLDGQPNRLFELRHRSSLKKLTITPEVLELLGDLPDEVREMVECPEEDNEAASSRELAESLYNPSIEHTAVPGLPDEHAVHRINVRGTVVRFAEDTWSITMTVEGDLDPTIAGGIASELQSKLSKVEGTPYGLRAF